jgi:hypothetical protein
MRRESELSGVSMLAFLGGRECRWSRSHPSSNPYDFQHSPAQFRRFPPLCPGRAESILLSPSADASVSRQRQGVETCFVDGAVRKERHNREAQSPIFYDDEVIGFGL